MSLLEDAADGLAAADDFFGLAVDPEWREARRYPPTSEDGHEAIVSVARMPARFWRIQSPGLELDLGTGSGTRMRATWRTRSPGPSRTGCSASATRSRS